MLQKQQCLLQQRLLQGLPQLQLRMRVLQRLRERLRMPKHEEVASAFLPFPPGEGRGEGALDSVQAPPTKTHSRPRSQARPAFPFALPVAEFARIRPETRSPRVPTPQKHPRQQPLRRPRRTDNPVHLLRLPPHRLPHPPAAPLRAGSTTPRAHHPTSYST